MRRVLALACVVAGVAVVAPVASSAPASTTRAHMAVAALESGVLQQLNVVRAQHGLAPLRANPALAAAAEQHSREMGVDGYFDHSSADGTAFWVRVGHWYRSSGFSRWSVGENLLWYSPDVAPATALDVWMHSPEHRANILNPRWREIGIGAVHVTSAGGTYRHLPVTILTADFGVRR